MKSARGRLISECAPGDFAFFNSLTQAHYFGPVTPGPSLQARYFRPLRSSGIRVEERKDSGLSNSCALGKIPLQIRSRVAMSRVSRIFSQKALASRANFGETSRPRSDLNSCCDGALVARCLRYMPAAVAFAMPSAASFSSTWWKPALALHGLRSRRRTADPVLVPPFLLALRCAREDAGREALFAARPIQ